MVWYTLLPLTYLTSRGLWKNFFKPCILTNRQSVCVLCGELRSRKDRIGDKLRSRNDRIGDELWTRYNALSMFSRANCFSPQSHVALFTTDNIGCVCERERQTE